MERSPSGHAVRAVLALLATAALLAPVFVLHALPATELDAVGLGWVIPALAVVLLGTAGAATVAALVTGLRYGSLASLLLAGSSAALVGGSLARLGGAGTIALSILAAAGLMLAAAVAERLGTLVAGRRARLVTAGVAARPRRGHGHLRGAPAGHGRHRSLPPGAAGGRGRARRPGVDRRCHARSCPGGGHWRSAPPPLRSRGGRARSSHSASWRWPAPGS